jgi:PAS domain S-box-containing protein
MKDKATRVLLVEDNPGDARLIQEMLREAGEGYQLEWVPQLSDGLERLARGEIDLVLLDLGLPDSQGLDTFIRAFSHAPQVPFVVLSGLDDETIAVTAVREGAQDYLVKGQVDGSLLVRAMRYASERKRAEEAVRESEEKYRLLVQQIPAVVFKGYPDWSVDFFDDKIEALTGYAKEDFEARRLRWIDLILPEDLEETKRIFLEALKTTRSYVREHRIRRKDGEISWVQSRGRIISDADGQVAYIDGVLFDITDRKLAEEALQRAHDELEARVAERTAELTLANRQLQEERRRLFEVLEMLPVYVVLLTPDYRVPFANRTFRERFGESQGRRCYEFLFDRVEPCEICKAYDVLKTGKPQEWEWTGPDSRNYHIFDLPFTDSDSSPLILEMGIDITERKQAEEQLRAVSAYARSLIEASLDPLVTISPAGKITDVNLATEEATGIPRERLIGSDFSDYFTEPDKAREGYQQVLAQGFVRDYSLALRHVSGRIMDVLYNASTYKNGGGEVQGVFAAARDITERKRAEEALKQAHDELEQKVAERTAELTLANVQLQLEVEERRRTEGALLQNQARFKAFMRHLPGVAFIRDRQGRYLFANEAWEKAFYPARKDWFGKTIEQIWPPELADWFKEKDEKVLADKTAVQYFASIEQQDGLHNWLCHQFPIMDESGGVLLVGGVGIDITEQKRAEEELRESEERFRATFEQAAVGLALVGPDLKWLRVNQKLCDIVGYSREELLGGTFQEITYAEDLEPNLHLVRQLRAGEIQTYGMEKRYVRKDGSLVWINLTVSMVREPSGEPKYSIAVIEDITARKQAEAELRVSEARFRELFDNMSSGVSVFEAVDQGRDFIFKDFNRAGERIDQVRKSDLIGQSVLEKFPGVQEFGLFGVLQRVWQTGQPEFWPEAFYRDERRSGWRENYVYKLPSGEVVAIFEDITEKKEAEERLRESEKKYRRLIENAQEGIWRIDAAGNTIFVNERMAEMLGYSVEEMLGQPIFRFADEFWADQARRNFEQGIRGQVDFEFLKKDGSRLHAIIEDTPIFDDDGNFAGALGCIIDITERKQAEEKLRQSEARLAEAQRISHLGNWEWDQITGQAIWSDEVYRIFNLDPQQVPPSYEAFLSFVHPDDREMFENKIKETISGRQPLSVDFRLELRDGSVRFVHEEAEQILDPAGNPSRWVGTVQDITERKLAEEALRASEERYRRLFDASNDAVFVHPAITDREPGRFSDVNEVACRMLGYTREELLRLSVADIGDPENAEEFPARREKLGAEKQILFETTLVTSDGRKIPVEVSSRLFELGGQTLVLSVVRDITERQRAQQALEAERRRLFSLLDELPAFVYLVAQDYSIRFANRVFRENFGEPAGKFCYEVINQAKTRCPECQTFNIFRTGKPQSFEWVPRGGRTLQLYEYPFTDVDGSPLGLVLGMDITERKLQEKKLEESEKNLRYLASQLLNAQERERRRISRELHDELGQSLLVLKLQLQSISREQAKAKGVAKEDLGDILAYVDGVIDNVRRISRDLSPTMLEDLGFSAALKRLLDSFQKHYDLQKFSLDLDEIDNLMSPEAKINIYRIFQESLTNIGKYAQAGRVAVSIKKRKGQILFQVEDNGKGFNMAQVLGGSASSRGLGLAAMEERVRMLGGALKIRSREGSGTKISFTIPIKHPNRTS